MTNVPHPLKTVLDELATMQLSIFEDLISFKLVDRMAESARKMLGGQTHLEYRGQRLTPELINDEAAFAKFQQAQSQMTSALSRLLVVAENYPQLKADAGFRDLQAQLEGTENRVTVARNRYIDAVRAYNVTVREFPTNLTAKWFDYEVKPNFTVENEAAVSTAPSVQFDTTTPSQPATPEQPERATPPASN